MLSWNISIWDRLLRVRLEQNQSDLQPGIFPGSHTEHGLGWCQGVPRELRQAQQWSGRMPQETGTATACGRNLGRAITGNL